MIADERIIKGQQERPVETGSEGLSPPRSGASSKINLKRERFMTLLRERYGYTNEKAIDEMERLLKQFSTTNESLKIKRTRRSLKTPFLE